MSRTTRSLATVVSAAALMLTACAGQDPDPATTPAPTATGGGLTAEPTEGPPHEETDEVTEEATTEPSGGAESTEKAATDDAPEGAEDATEGSTEDEGSGDGSGAAAISPPEGLPDSIVEEEPVWTAAGTYLGVVGEVAAFEQDRDGGSTIVALHADGSQAWEHAIETPSAIEPGTESTAFATGTLHHYIVTWVGDSADTGERIFVVSTLDPATGEEVAGGQVEVPGARAVQELASLDEVWVQTDSGSTIVHLPLDGGEELTVGESSWGEHPVVPVNRSLAVLVDGAESTVQLVDRDLAPVGEARRCSWPEGPGWAYTWNTSADGTLVAAPGSIINLQTGEVDCLTTTDMDVAAQGVGNDGRVIAAVSTADGPMGMVLQFGEGGPGVVQDADATAAARAILDDVVLFEADGGWSAHQIKTF